jgi:hypothetical protein
VFSFLHFGTLRNLSDAEKGLGKGGWRSLRAPPNPDNREGRILNGDQVVMKRRGRGQIRNLLAQAHRLRPFPDSNLGDDISDRDYRCPSINQIEATKSNVVIEINKSTER